MRLLRSPWLLCCCSILAACSGGKSGTTGGNSANTSSGTSGSPTGTSQGATSATGTSGSVGSGTGGSYQGYDGGPHQITLPNAAAADAGCDLLAPLLSDAGFCTQCLSDSDCPAPTVCETSTTANTPNVCVQCSIAEPTCPSGELCDIGNTDRCVPNCSMGPSCMTALGGYCNLDAGSGQIGCVVGCRTNVDCAASAAYCDPATNLCGPCLEGAPGSGGGCPTGQICGYGVDDVPSCVLDCRLDAGICQPGICDADAGSGYVQCLPGECASDADCAGSDAPHCAGGECAQCAVDSDCQALGTGTPICLAGGACGVSCAGDPTGCGAEQCIFVDGGGGDTCLCASDLDCAGQALAPRCVPMAPDAGLDAGAGLFGQCGCTLGDCGAGTVCESRFDVLSLVTPNPSQALCIPPCTTAQIDCARDIDSNTLCNPTTGYCVSCVDDSQCDADGGLPTCVPLDAGLPTGGGSCGCVPGACGDGDVCDPTLGFCHPACSYGSDGYDTCLDQGSSFPLVLCNSETGLCQQCFAAADCAGQQAVSPAGGAYPLNLCSDAGLCYGCNTAADCPPTLPGCSSGVCGACLTSADCASGDSCSPWGTCLPSCTPSGGQCAANPAAPICEQSVCVQCLTSADCGDAGLLCENGDCLNEE